MNNELKLGFREIETSGTVADHHGRASTTHHRSGNCLLVFLWLLNGLDKFFARQDIGFVRWWGNHRVEKFSMYFEKLQLDAAYVQLNADFRRARRVRGSRIFRLGGGCVFSRAARGSLIARIWQLPCRLSCFSALRFRCDRRRPGRAAGTFDLYWCAAHFVLAVAAESFFQHLRDLTARARSTGAILRKLSNPRSMLQVARIGGAGEQAPPSS